MIIILLSGGSGKRLWPLSNDVRSKQFLKIFTKDDGSRESMGQRMYRLIKDIDPEANITVATSESQKLKDYVESERPMYERREWRSIECWILNHVLMVKTV